jgi:ABC-type spermidine/putrescine transport system permease subunit II
MLNLYFDFESLAIAYSFVTVAILTTSLRLVVRKRVRWGWDDLFAVLATLSMVFQCVVIGIRLLDLVYQPGKDSNSKPTHISCDQLIRLSATPSNVKLNVAVFYMNGMSLPMEDW